MTDPIADMLNRIRNAIAARKVSVNIPHSSLKEGIAGILKKQGFITDFKVETNGFKYLVIDLAEPKISTLTRMSKPGRRVYASSKDIPLVLSGRGIVIVSTSSGVMTGREARQKGLGGELICKVW